jgi:hypothetical protein
MIVLSPKGTEGRDQVDDGGLARLMSAKHFSDIAAVTNDVRSRGDTVAKVVLQKVSKIPRTAGALLV